MTTKQKILIVDDDECTSRSFESVLDKRMF